MYFMTCKYFFFVSNVSVFWRGNLKERDHLVDPARSWEDNIKMDLEKVECGGMDWIELAQDI